MTDIEILEIMVSAIEKIELNEFSDSWEGNGEITYSLDTSRAISYLYDEINLRKSQ